MCVLGSRKEGEKGEEAKSVSCIPLATHTRGQAEINMYLLSSMVVNQGLLK